ncbi:MAG: hypothetical protein HY862_06325 [Chloroflexi bacterium]|nr:hypothetical protein [Chloroflexota bacterium]
MATSQRKLQTLFGFTDTDLNANRKGRLSAAQIKELQDQSVYELKMLLGIPAVLATGSMLMLDLMVALPVIIVMLAITGGLVALHREHLKTIRDKQVQKLAGQLIKHPLTNGSIQYIISIAGRHLPVERGMYEELSDGYFAVYLLEDSHHILSIEPIAKSTVKTPAKTPTKLPAKAPIKSTPTARSTKPVAKTSTAKPAAAKSTKPVVKTPVTATKSVKATALQSKATPVAKPAKPKGVVKPQPPAAIGRSRSS